MEKSHAGHYGALIALMIVMNAAMAFGQSHGAATADAALGAEMIAVINDMSAGGSRFVKSEYRHQDNLNEQ